MTIEDNVLKLPKIIPGDEVKELLEWVENLTLSELIEIKKMWESKNDCA